MTRRMFQRPRDDCANLNRHDVMLSQEENRLLVGWIAGLFRSSPQIRIAAQAPDSDTRDTRQPCLSARATRTGVRSRGIRSASLPCAVPGRPAHCFRIRRHPGLTSSGQRIAVGGPFTSPESRCGVRSKRSCRTKQRETGRCWKEAAPRSGSTQLIQAQARCRVSWHYTKAE